VLDDRPALTIIVVNVPIGSLDDLSSVQRSCDREARALLQGGSSALESPSPWTYLPSKFDGDVHTRDDESDFFQARRDEVALEISPSSQRVVYEGHPDLSFYQLNGYEVPSWSHDDRDADDQRRAMLELKIPGVARVLDVEGLGVSPRELIDVAALMWTARRVFGHSAARLPSEGEWDARGLRMELVM
jgi:predicted RNase H-like nuclease